MKPEFARPNHLQTDLNRGLLCSAVAGIFAVAGCGQSPGPSGSSGPVGSSGLADVLTSKAGRAPWGLLTLVAHDNDLSGSATSYQNAAKSLARIPNLSSVTIHDTPGTGGVLVYGFNGQWVNGKDKELNSGSVEAVDALLSWGSKNFPSEKKAVVLADHGGGIVRGIMVDDSSGHAGIKIADLAQSLSKQPVDILMFDACLMNMVEVAYELRTGTTTIVGAESVSYAGSWPYDEVGRAMSQGGSAEATTRRIVDAVGPKVYRSTISGVTTAGTEATIGAIDRLAKVGIAKMKSEPRLKGELAEVIGRGQSYKFSDNPHYSLYNSYRDLVSMARHLAAFPDPELARLAEDLEASAKKMVIRSWRDEQNYPDTHGISIYAPVDGNVDLGYARNAAMAKDTLWDEFLVALNSRGNFGNPLQPDKYPKSFPRLLYPGN